MPAEWHPQDAVWMAWPWDEGEWDGEIDAARGEVAELARTLAAGQTVEMLVTPAARASASRALDGSPVRLRECPYGDIWLRDTGCVFLVGDGQLSAARFRWTGWAGKFVFEYDDGVAVRMAAMAGVPLFSHELACEGGAVDVDGDGTILTTRQCLLHRDRNRSASEEDVGKALCKALGADKVIWLDRGLANDHTDGHIDTLARFVGPGKVVCMAPTAHDPNVDVLSDIRRMLTKETDAAGRSLQVIELPSPGAVHNRHGELLAASYCNFYIGNGQVVVPCYGVASDAEAVAILGQVFADREVVGLDARATLTGGGAFHCITQQQPAAHPVEPS